jgi:uncharacterized membrane protein (UPF0127 family)
MPLIARSAALAVLALLMLAGMARADLAKFDHSTLTIDTKDGARRFDIELALSPAQQEQGLMYRREMAADAGMLFIFPAAEIARFWMHNTLIPLDMVFIAADGHIAGIHERAVPMNDEAISSETPVLAVLELNGGTASRLGIKAGDLVHYATFGTAPGSELPKR